jgi:2-polyprenyl-6-methoxyphenol hydroxylase-like FAD-dependent oxidoreductase
MEEDDSHRIVIVGGGPTGLSLALSLARYGIHTIVFEKQLESRESSPHSDAFGNEIFSVAWN